MRSPVAFLCAVVAPCCLYAQALSVPWSGYGHDPQHTGNSAVAAQPLSNIHWSAPMDLNPPGGGTGNLYIHYGTPMVTAANTVIVSVSSVGTGAALTSPNGSSNGSVFLQYTFASATPEPTTVSMLGIGLLALGFSARKLRKQ